jgi:hypothetical protein
MQATNARQVILTILKHSVGWNQELIEKNLLRFNEIPVDVTRSEINMLVHKKIVERREDGFVSLPDTEDGLLVRIFRSLTMNLMVA